MSGEMQCKSGAKVLHDVGTVAKSIGTGRNRLFDFLREKNLLNHMSIPYQRYIDRGYFEVKQQKYKQGKVLRMRMKTMLTASGVEYVKRLWQESGDVQGVLDFG
jgi:phage antirepressor YoqD-like protein